MRLPIRLSKAVLLCAVAAGLAFPFCSAVHAEEDAAVAKVWTPEVGDRFLVDTEENMGYLVHRSGKYTVFRVATGQRKTVHYIGRTYNARTPNQMWIARTEEVKGDRITFGYRGIFLRLFSKNGTESSPYGIHSHRSIQSMLEGDTRYRSMGCILVSDAALDMIRATLNLNGMELPVLTVEQIDERGVLATLEESESRLFAKDLADEQ